MFDGRGSPVTENRFSISLTGMYVPSDQFISPVVRFLFFGSLESVM
jgi:hypothetical protein